MITFLAHDMYTSLTLRIFCRATEIMLGWGGVAMGR